MVMKLLEVFKTRQAGTFAAEPSIDPRNIPSHDACNCADLLLGEKSAEVKSGLDNGGDKRSFHKEILGNWMDLLFNTSNRSKAKETLSEVKRRQEVSSPGEEFKRHFIMHMDGAGVSHRDLGFSDNELSADYVAGRNKALAATGSVEPTDYDEEHCGTCDSYLTSLKNKAIDFKDSMGRKNEMLPDVQKPYAAMSTAGLLSRILDSWTKKNPIKENDHPSVVEGNEIVKNWNDHTQKDHGNSLLSPVSHFNYTPVVEDTNGESMDNLLDDLNSTNGGWGETLRPDIPENTLSKGTRKTLEQEFPNENVYETFLQKVITPADQQRAEDIAKGMELKGEMKRYTLDSELPAVKVTESETSGPKLLHDKLDDKYIPVIETKPLQYDQSGKVSPLNVIEMPGLTSLSRGINRVVERKTIPTQLNWDPLKVTRDPVTGEERIPSDSWYSQPVEYNTDRPEIVQTWTNHKHDGTCSHDSHKGAEGSKCDGWHADDISDLMRIPREDAFLFQKAGVQPDIASHKQYLKDLNAYETQPTHITVDTGRTETSEEPQFERRQRLDENGNAVLTRTPLVKISPTPQGRPNIVKLPVYDVVPTLDETGNQITKTVVKPVFEMRRIPEEERLQAPSKEQATKDYTRSYATALAKAYPGLQAEEARSALAKEHSQEVQRLMSRTEKVRLSSKKEDEMKKFNSGNNKEAHVDPNMIDLHALGHMVWNGLKDVGHAAMTPINQIRTIVDTPQGDPGGHSLDAAVQLMGEGYGAARLLEKGVDKYDEAYKLRPEVKEKVNKLKRILHPIKGASFSERFAAEKKSTPCEKCGKNCKNSVECKENVNQRRREKAAESAFND